MLHTFPKCKSSKEQDLEEHLDDFEEMVDLYGQQLQQHAPMSLRVMLLRTLPKELEDEVLDKPKLRTMEDIIEHIRAKLIYKNQKNLAAYIRPGSHVNALQVEDSDSDDADDGPTGKTITRSRPSRTEKSISALTLSLIHI